MFLRGSSPRVAAEKVYQYYIIKIDPVVQLVRMPPCHLVMSDEMGSSPSRTLEKVYQYFIKN